MTAELHSQRINTQPGRKAGQSALFLHNCIGLVATVGFYYWFMNTPWALQKFGGYFIGHEVEYVATFLFFCSCSILLGKWLGVMSNSKVLRELQRSLRSFQDQQLSATEVYKKLHGLIQPLSSGERQTLLPQRLLHLVNYIETSGSIQGVGDHLQQHSNIDYDRFQRSFGFFNTAVWAIPILGFLGTVLGITIAIAHVTPEQLTSSLQEVTKGLAVAFDTTAQSLGLSFILVFAKLLVSSLEEHQLAEVDQTMIDLVLPYFVDEGGTNPQQIHSQTSQEMFLASREMVNQHVAAWTQATAQLRQQWADIANNQSTQLSQGLEHGLTLALQTHLHELKSSRDEYTQLMSGLFEESSRRIQRQELQLSQQHAELLTQQKEFFAEFNQHFEDQIRAWRTETAQIQSEFREMTNALQTTAHILTDLHDSHEQLGGMQVQMSQNLQLLTSTANFEQTLDTLNAAVHLLSARTRNAA